MRSLAWFVRACAVYNAIGALAFVTPGALDLLGVRSPGSTFWLWLPALFATFAAIVLWVSSNDLGRLAALPYWNGIIRFTWVFLTLALDFGTQVGSFATLLALGDLPLAVGAVIVLPRVLGRSHLSLLTLDMPHRGGRPAVGQR